MFRAVVTFASFTVVSANCAENPSSPECAARGQDLLQKHASFGAGGAGLQLEATPLMLGSTVTKNLPTFFFCFFCCWEKITLAIWSFGKSLKENWQNLQLQTRVFFLSFGFACPRMNHSTYETHVRMSFATLQQKTEESYAHARKLRSRSRLQIERTDLISDYRSKGTKTFRRDATCIENASWRGSLPFFHVISGILNECWENFHKVLSRKAWKDCKTLFILAFLRFFPLHGGAIISLDELAFRWIS